MFNLTVYELKIMRKINTPIKIQDYIDTFPINWGEGYMSPRKTLREGKMHCMEGAFFAAATLWINSGINGDINRDKPLLLDLKTVGDHDHVVALYKRNGYWGAISKTNHASLRFRDPVYKTVRELAMSYFHEYFNDSTGKKALREYSTAPFDLSKYGNEWITSEKDLGYIVEKLDFARHSSAWPKKNTKYIRKADPMERKAGKLTEWKNKK